MRALVNSAAVAGRPAGVDLRLVSLSVVRQVGVGDPRHDPSPGLLRRLDGMPGIARSTAGGLS